MQVPLLTRPSTIFQLLTGKDVDLFIFEMPKLEFSFEYVQSFPIFTGLNARLGGILAATIQLGFGYDTSGIRQAFETKEWEAVFNGFFLTDHFPTDSKGEFILEDGELIDENEVELSATIFAGASLGVAGIVEAGVDGGITATIGFDLNDITAWGQETIAPA